MILFKGNPFVLVFTAIIFSVISIVMLLTSWDWFYSFVLFSVFYSTVITVVLYIAYKRSDFAFMSPKKYKKNELIYKKNQKLYEQLIEIDKSNTSLKPDNAIDKAIEMISKM